MRWRITASDPRAAGQLAAWVEQENIEAMVCSGDWPPADEAHADADALLLGGGGDLADAPGRYVGPALSLRGVRAARDVAELAWVSAFARAGRPVFGVCRGMQVIAVALGGCLIADLRTAMPDLKEPHEGMGGDVCHGLRARGTGEMAAVLREVSAVNSSHHQAVLGPGAFIVSATSEAGIVEAIETRPGAPVRAFAVQWHPERLPSNDPAARRVLHFWAEEARR